MQTCVPWVWGISTYHPLVKFFVITSGKRSLILKNTIFLIMTGLLSVSSFAAIAETSAIQNSNHADERPPAKTVETPFVLNDFLDALYRGMTNALTAGKGLTGHQSLEKAILENAEKQRQAGAEKYTRIAALAGDKKDELEKRRNEVTRTYQKWHDLKSAMTAFPNKAKADNFKAIEEAAQAYAEAKKAFIELQKTILARAHVSHKHQAAYLVVMR